MSPRGISEILDSFALKRKGQAFESISTVEEFQKILLRERSRADRSGLIFSLLTFDLEPLRSAQISVSDLARFLLHRVRTTDTVGGFDGHHLGLLLPDTPESGARKLAEDIWRQVSATIPGLICKVHSYPPQKLSLAAEQQPVDSDKNLCSDGIGSMRGRDPSTVLVSGRSEGAASLSGVKSDNRENTCWRIHPFLARRIPMWKRVIDIIGAVVALVLLAPLFLLIAAVIKLSSPGPVLFKQERIGYLGKPFSFWKFRTMRVDINIIPHKEYMSQLINNDIPMKKLDASDDARIIPFGVFLRKSCLDELPQLLNVLLGQMSLVGPRPCLPYEAEEYLRWHTRRFDSVPGMTGLWQISGKNRTTFREMIRLDINYERKMSIWLDLKILLMTLPALISMATEPLVASRGGLDGRTAQACRRLYKDGC
jgi:lipopolysaccharide/colanic/teichoic acid biosynthesis glycosyltransferase